MNAEIASASSFPFESDSITYESPLLAGNNLIRLSKFLRQ
jgi:hypothetical protein